MQRNYEELLQLYACIVYIPLRLTVEQEKEIFGHYAKARSFTHLVDYMAFYVDKESFFTFPYYLNVFTKSLVRTY